MVTYSSNMKPIWKPQKTDENQKKIQPDTDFICFGLFLEYVILLKNALCTTCIIYTEWFILFCVSILTSDNLWTLWQVTTKPARIHSSWFQRYLQISFHSITNHENGKFNSIQSHYTNWWHVNTPPLEFTTSSSFLLRDWSDEVPSLYRRLRIHTYEKSMEKAA